MESIGNLENNYRNPTDVQRNYLQLSIAICRGSTAPLKYPYRIERSGLDCLVPTVHMEWISLCLTTPIKNIGLILAMHMGLPRLMNLFLIINMG